MRYKELAKKFHPDLNMDDPGGADKMAKITNAYDFLMDPGKRRTFDAKAQEEQMQERGGRAGRGAAEGIDDLDSDGSFEGAGRGAMGGAGRGSGR